LASAELPRAHELCEADSRPPARTAPSPPCRSTVHITHSGRGRRGRRSSGCWSRNASDGMSGRPVDRVGFIPYGRGADPPGASWSPP